jgi:hypothetical protein
MALAIAPAWVFVKCGGCCIWEGAALEQQLKAQTNATECSGLELSSAARPGKAGERTCERPMLSYLLFLQHQGRTPKPSGTNEVLEKQTKSGWRLCAIFCLKLGLSCSPGGSRRTRSFRKREEGYPTLHENVVPVTIVWCVYQSWQTMFQQIVFFTGEISGDLAPRYTSIVVFVFLSIYTFSERAALTIKVPFGTLWDAQARPPQTIVCYQ